MIFRWFVLILLSVAAHAAEFARVDTLSGEQLAGEFRIEPDKVVITDTNGAATEVPLAELKRFQSVQPNAPTNSLTILANPPEHGLLGIYFNTPDCSGDFFKTRYDPSVDFDWGQSAPLPDMNSNGFSVRWIGRLVVANTEHYTFHTVTDDGVRLWLNNKLIIDAWKDEFLNLAAPPLILIGGQTNEIRMEMYDARDRAVARLFWSSPTTPRSIIPKERLIPASNVDLPTAPVSKPKYVPGVLLVNGSLLPGSVESADRSSVHLAGLPAPLSRIQVARLILQPIREPEESILQRGRPGVLLKNGDFIEGDFGGIRGGEIDIGSVILGPKKISVGQAVAVVFGAPRPRAAKYEITTRQGGLYRATNLRLQKDTLLINDPALPATQLNAADLLEVRVTPRK
jgi:hypothetical protein